MKTAIVFKKQVRATELWQDSCILEKKMLRKCTICRLFSMWSLTVQIIQTLLSVLNERALKPLSVIIRHACYVGLTLKSDGEGLGLIHVCEPDPLVFCVYLWFHFGLSICCYVCIYDLLSHSSNVSSVPFVIFVVPLYCSVFWCCHAPSPTLSVDLLAPLWREEKEVRRRWLWRWSASLPAGTTWSSTPQSYYTTTSL